MLALFRRPKSRDSLLIFFTVLLSAGSYVSALGFYSDDWAYQEVFARFSSKGVRVMARELMNSDPATRVRPIQVAYLVLGYKLFGVHPLGYHLFNLLMLCATAILLYFVLQEFKASRFVALSSALVLACLPHYTSDRFWIAAHQITFSMAFGLFGILACSRSTHAEGLRQIKWSLAATFALLASLLSYEIALVPIAAVVTAIVLRVFAPPRPHISDLLRRLRGVLTMAVLLLFAGILKMHLQTRMNLNTDSSGHVWILLWHLAGRLPALVRLYFQFTVWEYGVRLPAILLRLSKEGAISSSAVVCAMCMAVVIGCALWRLRAKWEQPSVRSCALLALLSFGLFLAGFALFSLEEFPQDVEAVSAGVGNRIMYASTVGAALLWVALIQLAALMLRNSESRAKAVGVAVTLVCCANSLVVSGVAHYWTEAVPAQQAIVDSVRQGVKHLPQGSVLLLQGFCPYHGPAIVFETDWDTTAAVRFALKDPSLIGDVAGPTARPVASSINTYLYGYVEGSYFYGQRLFLYDVTSGTLSNLQNKRDAVLALDRATTECPAGRAGIGNAIW